MHSVCSVYIYIRWFGMHSAHCVRKCIKKCRRARTNKKGSMTGAEFCVLSEVSYFPHHTHTHTHMRWITHTRETRTSTHTHAHIVNIREACGEFEMPFLPLAALLLLHRLTSFSFCLFTHIFAIRVRVFDSAGQPRNMRPAIRRHTCILYILYECTRIQAYTKNTNAHLIAHTLRAAYNNIHIEHNYIATCERNWLRVALHCAVLAFI